MNYLCFKKFEIFTMPQHFSAWLYIRYILTYILSVFGTQSITWFSCSFLQINFAVSKLEKFEFGLNINHASGLISDYYSSILKYIAKFLETDVVEKYVNRDLNNNLWTYLLIFRSTLDSSNQPPEALWVFLNIWNYILDIHT